MNATILFTLSLMVMVMFARAADAWELPEFMISTWGGPEVEDADAKVAGLVAAGINTIRWDLDDLETIRRHDLKAIVDGAKPADATRLQDDDVIWGYHLVDEPETDLFPDIARQVEAFRRADPNHPTYVNLFARAGDHATAFVDIVKPDFLSYDFYQWWYGDYQKWWEGARGYFSRLEQHRTAALRAGIPLINWVEVVANKHDDRYRNVAVPSDSDPKVRQSLYTGLAYGLKGVQWFHGGLLYEKGSAELNECGRHVAALNAELKRLGPTLIGLESTDVFHTPPLPRGTRESPLQHWVLPEGGELVLGVFEDGKRRPHLMVVNRRVDHGSHARLVFQRKIGGVERFNRADGSWEGLPLTIREDRADAYDGERITKFLGVPARARDRMEHLRTINSYLPPFQVVELMLDAGDGELLRIVD